MKRCTLCDAEMVAMPVVTPSARSMVVAFCRKCDRRRCNDCGHHEQNVSARKCSHCGVTF